LSSTEWILNLIYSLSPGLDPPDWLVADDVFLRQEPDEEEDDDEDGGGKDDDDDDEDSADDGYSE